MTSGTQRRIHKSQDANCKPLDTIWRRRSESNRRIQLLQSRALPLGYSAYSGAKHNGVPPPRKRKFVSGFRLFSVTEKTPDDYDCQLTEHPSLPLFFQRAFGLKIPIGVMMPVMSSGGVTSKAGLRAPLPGFATRT